MCACLLDGREITSVPRRDISRADCIWRHGTLEWRCYLPTDSELVQRARKGEQAAFDALVRRYQDVVRRIATSFAAIPEDADDLVQEAFVTAYLRLGQLSDPDRFGSWLTAIVRNEGRMWHRRRQVQPVLFSLDGDDDAESSSHAAKASARRARELERKNVVREAVVEALSGLSAKQRQAVQMYYLQGYDYGETASLLNVPIAAVRGRLDRARGVLRRELKDMANTPNRGWILNKRDLDAFRAAATMASQDPELAAINALCLTGEGQLVSTDTHRLFVYSGESLKDVPAALIPASFGRELRDTYADSHKGNLTIDDGEAVLRLEEGWEIRAPLLREAFPNWRAIMPGESATKAIARSGDWLQALELLASEGEAARYKGHPRVLVVIMPPERQITLRQGYEQGQEAGKLAREVSVWFPAEGFPVSNRELILAMNPNYLGQAIRFLGLPEDARVELCTSNWSSPVLTQAVGGGDTVIVTMPMERAAPSRPEESAAEPVASGA